MKRHRFVQWAMMCSAFAVLFAMVAPHHHHADGAICIESHAVHGMDGGHGGCCDGCAGEDSGCDPSQHNDCGRLGHNPVFTVNEDGPVHDGIPFLLIPLQVVFDAYSLSRPFCSAYSPVHRCIYAEALYDACVLGCSGLRGPPCFG